MENLGGLIVIENLNFYNGKKVLVTGHTGFKGSWLSKILIDLGADVVGYSLSPEADSLFEISGIAAQMKSIIGDIRNRELLEEIFISELPEIVFHLAAQPIVRKSYNDPVYTYETNVMGTVNICECVRKNKSVRSFLNITTDKVYENKEWEWGYREIEPLDGYDPYSNSKSCSELVTHSYIRSFFNDLDLAVSTARAGNVIGGGDFAVDRIIPDCIRAATIGNEIIVRNPFSIRPYQHVLEPLSVYLQIAMKQYGNRRFSDYYNVGPDEADCLTTGELVNLFCEKWGEDITWKNVSENGPHEANFLKLDCSKIKKVFHWKPVWNIDMAVEKTVQFSKSMIADKNIAEVMRSQINDFFSLAGEK